jgi:hypothetical protein
MYAANAVAIRRIRRGRQRGYPPMVSTDDGYTIVMDRFVGQYERTFGS